MMADTMTFVKEHILLKAMFLKSLYYINTLLSRPLVCFLFYFYSILYFTILATRDLHAKKAKVFL